jgi:hypothetical protein
VVLDFAEQVEETDRRPEHQADVLGVPRLPESGAALKMRKELRVRCAPVIVQVFQSESGQPEKRRIKF